MLPSFSYSAEPGAAPGTEAKGPMLKAPFTREEAAAAQKECGKRLGLPVEITNSIGMKLKLIPAGEFMMGSTKSPQEVVRMFDLPEAGAKFFATTLASEHSQHKVRITKPFYLGVHEVTQAEYEKVTGKNPSSFAKGGKEADRVSGKDTSNHPAEFVNWDEAVEFCKRLSVKEGKTYRLPTDAEWEYACRAGTTTVYSFGDGSSQLGEYAWFGNNSGDQLLDADAIFKPGSDNYRKRLDANNCKPHPVGRKKPNAWGLFDMHGNVWEWCADWYDKDYYADSPTDDPPGPETGSYRVFRGGGWALVAGTCRAAVRHGLAPHIRVGVLGFRVAADPSGK